MRNIVLSGAVLAAVVFFGAAPAGAGSPSRQYPNCDALLKAFPNGVAESSQAAQRAVADRKRRPAVNPKVYRENTARDGDRDRVACEQFA
jgi:hypothetical protein